MIKINNNLGVSDSISGSLLQDPLACSLLMYFILDHPGTEGGSIVSIQELSDFLLHTPKVVKKRIDRLEKAGHIVSLQRSHSEEGGKKLAKLYMINFESKLFLKPVKKPEPIRVTSDHDDLIKKFTDINLRIHGQEFKPTNAEEKQRWIKGAQKVMTLKPAGKEFDIDTYESVVEFLANQLKEFNTTGDKYKMRCKDMGNLVYKHPNAADCKYIKAYEMLKMRSSLSSHRDNLINNIEEENVPTRVNDTGDSRQSHGSIWEKA
jgi:hypothetical protein